MLLSPLGDFGAWTGSKYMRQAVLFPWGLAVGSADLGIHLSSRASVQAWRCEDRREAPHTAHGQFAQDVEEVAMSNSLHDSGLGKDILPA